MWIVKEQTRKRPNGVVVSPVMETQSGASTICKMLQEQADKNRAPDADPRHYYVTQYIKRGGKS